MGFVPMVDFMVLVGKKLGLRGHGLSIIVEDIPDVIFHREAASAFCIVPFDINACVFLSFPINCDGVVLP